MAAKKAPAKKAPAAQKTPAPKKAAPAKTAPAKTAPAKKSDRVLIAEGAAAPAFTANDQSGTAVKLADLKGKYVVLYFYPRDNTPGCTVEACSFRDEHTALQKAGAVVLGVSPDSEKTHQGFIAKQKLPFSLLADPNHELAEKYGAWGEKVFMGRRFMGILRTTYLIDPAGKVKTVWAKVKPEGHAQEVLAAIKA